MNDFLECLEEANKDRQLEWAGSEKVDYLFRMVELAGEVGELSNAVKKFHRATQGILGNKETPETVLRNLEEEVGDVLICLDLLLNSLEAEGINIDLQTAVRMKFNKTSEKHGLKTRL